jgi:gamma-glutamyltranspeptidase/glutathione hydrolase
MLRITGQAAAAGALGVSCSLAGARKPAAQEKRGLVVGDPVGAQVGGRVLAEGGNAMDAAIAAALATCITAPSRCGIGGYGGHMIIALAGGKRITSIDFNSTAPAAARPDMYSFDSKGEVTGRANFHGWLAVGVPGTLAGFQLALDRYGTRSFRELVQPAIAFARDGFTLSAGQAGALRATRAGLRNDPGSAKLYLNNGEPLKAGETARNPDLAHLLIRLAEKNSAEPFYRGDIAQRIADGIQKNGGLVTARDMAAYQAREVEPLRLKWNAFEIFTAPLTAGGLTVLEELSILKALRGKQLPSGPAGAHARLETLRVAWKDRLELLGDPEKVRVPVGRLLSGDYARSAAERIEAAVNAKQPLPLQIEKHLQDGTTNLSCVDGSGNLVAVTFTHGGGFGAQVTVDGLGLTLGHGMSRFNPRPGHPNSVAAHKRPLHNMCPSVVLRDGRPVLAVGAAGGVKIPNTIFDLLEQFVVRGSSIEEAIAAPRMHTTGALELTMERAWPQMEQDYLKQIGFNVQTGIGATASAVSFDPKTGECRAAVR